LTAQLVKYSGLPGLTVCHRQILTRQRNKQLLEQHPDLQFAVLMPWIEGPTWMEVMLAKDDPVWDSFVPQHSTALANALAQILTGMEQCGIAHCDLSASNVLLPALVESSPNTSAIELVDIEELYAANLAQPNALPGGSDGYAHKTAVSGLWSADADRFSGAVLIAEMLGWCDARVRRAAYGEQFFDPSEMQRDTERYRLLRMALKDCWSDPIAKTFERAWQSGQLSDCPSLAEWATRLREQTAGTRASVRATAALFNLRRDSKTGAAAHIVAQLDTDERVAPGEEGIALAQQFVARSAQREQEGDLDSAVADMHRALDLAPRGSALKQELAIALTELVNRQERMAELNPLVIQAKGFQNAGQWKQAATLYRELVNRASTSLQQVEWQQAYERCASEAELNALFDQGRLAFQQHRLEAAEEIWTEVVRRRPRYAQNGIQAATLLAQVFAERKGVQPGLFQQPLSNIGTFAAAAILGVFCVLVVLFSLLVFSQSKSETVRTECWLGVSGTKASITVKGSQAVQKCEDIADVRIVMPIVGTSYAEWRLVALDTAPRDSIFCQVEISGLRYEVRDQQTAIPPTVMGPSLCKWLDQLKATGATPGRPKIVPTAIATPRPTNPTPRAFPK
jgi:tetratricopeptide (TPR) repeat protein